MSRDEFIEKAKLIQDKDYDFSKVEYVNNKTKVCIACPQHGEFWVRPNDFLSGHMCKGCGIEKRAKFRAKTTDDFVEEAKKIFPQYDFSLVNYKNAYTHVNVVCPIHGVFSIKPLHLLHGHGCKKCGQISGHDKQRKTTEEFIAEAKKVHGDKYNYSKVVYVNRDTKVCIICPIHGEFWQTPHSHLNKQGCPYCSESKLEKEMTDFLTSKKISFEREKKFEWLGLQRLDFYLPQYNVAIECQGIQHFEPIKIFGGDNGFEERKKRDEKKKRLCIENGIRLLEYSIFQYEGVIKNKKKLLEEITNESEKDKLPF